MIGPECSGKTAIIDNLRGYSFERLRRSQPYLQDHIYHLKIDNKYIKIGDFPPPRNKGNLMPRLHMLSNGGAFCVVYSITSRMSFQKVEAFIDTILKGKKKLPPIVIVGNKCDEENKRQVPSRDGELLANKWNALFFEASAKFGINTHDAIAACVNLLSVEEVTELNPIIKCPPQSSASSNDPVMSELCSPDSVSTTHKESNCSIN